MQNESRFDIHGILTFPMLAFFFCATLFLFFQDKGFASILPGLKKAPLIFGTRIPFTILQAAIVLYPLALTIKHLKIAVAFVKNNKTYALFLGYCCISIFWSGRTLSSVYQAAALLVVVYYFWIYFYLRADPEKALVPIMHFLNALVCISLLAAILSPESAYHQFGENQGALKGIFGHKNILGHTALFAAVLNLNGLKKQRARIYSLLMCTAAFTALILAKSMATTIVCAISVVYFACLSLRRPQKRTQKQAQVFVPLVFLSVLAASSHFHWQKHMITGSADLVDKSRKTQTDLSEKYYASLKEFQVLDRSFAQEPNFIEGRLDAYTVIAKSYIKRGDYRIAVLWLRRGLQEDRNHVGLNRALYEFHSGIRRKDYATRLNNLKKADSFLDKLIAIDSDNRVQYLKDRVELYLYFKKYSKAEKVCLDALSTYPSEQAFILLLGRIYLESGDEEQFEKLVNKTRDRQKDIYNYLRFLKESKKSHYTKALDFLDKWIAEKERSGNIAYDDYFQKFKFLFDIKRFKKTLAFTTFLRKKYANQTAYAFEILNWKALLYDRIDDFKEAKEIFRRLSVGFPWLEGYYAEKMNVRAWGTIGPWLTRIFLNTPVETNFYKIIKRDFTFSNRAKIWYEMFRSILETPLFGKGYASFWDRSIAKSTILAKVHGAHNGYLDLLNELGIFGFCLFLCVWIPLSFKALQLYRSHNQHGVLLLTLFFMMSILNFSYPLLFRLNQGLLMMNIVIFASLFAEKATKVSES
ncbi:MAG: O-antigen ligase family protein [Candidatus Aminicenantes bacterium]|nr:O-antigen ligase family protein [Candidatus Aminicenantes bacterium]